MIDCVFTRRPPTSCLQWLGSWLSCRVSSASIYHALPYVSTPCDFNDASCQLTRRLLQYLIQSFCLDLTLFLPQGSKCSLDL